jgi:hypothetical protein
MKSYVLSSATVALSVVLASAIPVFGAEDGLFSRGQPIQEIRARDWQFDSDGVFARGAGFSKLVQNGVKSSLTNPRGAMDLDQKRKNRNNAIALATGNGPQPAANRPKAALNAFRATQAFKKAGADAAAKKSKRDVFHEELDARDFEEHSIFARGAGASKVAQFVAKKALINPKSTMDMHGKDKIKQDAKDLVTGNRPNTGPTSPKAALNAWRATQAFKKAGADAAAKKSKRDVFHEELDARDIETW